MTATISPSANTSSLPRNITRIRDRLLANGVAEATDFLDPQPASDDDILLVHTPDYVNKLRTGTLSAREELALEVPYSRDLVDAFWLAAGGSILAAQQALADRVSVNIGGGFHHAFPDHGEGFCMIHDVAVAIRRLQRDGKIRTAMTVDCDVHQGNGTAVIFAAKPRPRRPAPLRFGFARSHPRTPPQESQREPTSSPSRCISTTTIRSGSRRPPST